MSPGYELLEHTSEIELKLRAPTWAALLDQAGAALTARLWAGTDPVPRTGGTWQRVDLHAGDRAALLVDWLNELLYHAEAEWWLPVEFVIEEASDHTLHARVRGVPVAAAPATVKAATLYGAHVTHDAAGLEATVVLDI